GDHADLPGLARDDVLPSRALRVPRARDALSTRGIPGRDRRRDFYGRVDLDRARRRLRTDRRLRLRRVGLVRARTLARERLAWVARRGGRAPRRDRRVPRVHGSRVRGGRRPTHAPEAVRARAYRWPGASHRRTRVAARSRFRRGQLLRRLPRRTGALAHRGPVGARPRRSYGAALLRLRRGRISRAAAAPARALSRAHGVGDPLRVRAVLGTPGRAL